MSDRDPYEVLGIPETATEGDVKRAYRKLVMEWHPDRHQVDEAAARAAADKIKEINIAFESVLREQHQGALPGWAASILNQWRSIAGLARSGQVPEALDALAELTRHLRDQVSEVRETAMKMTETMIETANRGRQVLADVSSIWAAITNK